MAEWFQNTLAHINQSEGPISRLYSRHYAKASEQASELNTEELKNTISRYKKTVINTLVISFLGVIDGLAGLNVVSELVNPTTAAYLAGPTVVVLGLIGPIRGGWRVIEREIFKGELEGRNLPAAPLQQ